MRAGWSIPPRGSAPAPGRRCSARTWPGSPATATAPVTPATSGGCGCTWSAPRPGCLFPWALAHPKLDERQVLMAVLDHDAHLLTARPGLLIITDKGYASAELDEYLQRRGVELLPPAYRNRKPRPGQELLAPIRQLIESVNDTLKGQLDLELHGGRSLAGVTVRVAQRLLALTAAIWHNRATGQPITRSLIAYDH